MITTNVELHHRKNADGRKSVIIRFTENRKHKRISTGIRVHENDFNPNAKYGKWIRTSASNHESLNKSIQRIIEEYEKKAASINDISDIKKNEETADFFEYVDYEIEYYNKAEKYRSAEKLRHSTNKLKEYLKKEKLPFKQMTVRLLKDFQLYLSTEKKNQRNTIHADFKRMNTTFKNAINDGTITEIINPFENVKIKLEFRLRQKLSLEEIQKIENAKIPQNSKAYHVRNYFMFSFYCAGMRFSDFAMLRWENVKDDNHLKYEMSKTKGTKGASHSILLSNKAIDILSQYKTPSSKAKDFIFPLLKGFEGETSIRKIKQLISSRNVTVNGKLKLLNGICGIKKPITFHIARHSFADIIRKQTKDVFTISKLLGHTDIRTTQIYLAEFDLESQDQVMDDFAKSLDQVSKKGKIKK